MNNYEALLEKARTAGLIVKEKPLQASDGRIKGNRIAIRKDIDTTNEKSCVLAEELGHHYTSVGNILDLSETKNAKAEHQARLHGYNELIGLRGLIRAYEHGCRNWHEMADYLNVTDEYLQECINCYASKYGEKAFIDNYCVMFIPYFGVGKSIG